jgi:hypothetical protein
MRRIYLLFNYLLLTDVYMVTQLLYIRCYWKSIIDKKMFFSESTLTNESWWFKSYKN